jgi:adenine-specific DNA-methyltransferase
LYPTEKNADLLDLIIKTSSNTGSYVLDCFCGSGTTLKSAQNLGRNWIGIDQSEQALKVSAEKLNSISGDIFIQKPTYELITCDVQTNKNGTQHYVCEKAGFVLG